MSVPQSWLTEATKNRCILHPIPSNTSMVIATCAVNAAELIFSNSAKVSSVNWTVTTDRFSDWLAYVDSRAKGLLLHIDVKQTNIDPSNYVVFSSSGGTCHKFLYPQIANLDVGMDVSVFKNPNENYVFWASRVSGTFTVTAYLHGYYIHLAP